MLLSPAGLGLKSQRRRGKRSRKHLENTVSGCRAAPQAVQAERSQRGVPLGFRDIYVNSGRRSWVREMGLTELFPLEKSNLKSHGKVLTLP